MSESVNPSLTVIADNTELFDAIINSKTAVPTLKDGGDLSIVTKHGMMEPSGAAGACLTFTVDTDGTLSRAQTVVSVKILITLLRILESSYTDEGLPRGKKQ